MSRALWENQGHGDQTSSVLHLRPGSHRSPGGEQGQPVPPRKAPPFPSPPASELTPMTVSQYHAQGPRRVLLRRSACVFSPWDMCVPMLKAGSRGSDSEVHSRGLSGSVEVRLEKALLVPKRSGDVLKQQLCEGSSQWLGMGAEPPLMSGCPCQQPPLTAPSHCGEWGLSLAAFWAQRMPKTSPGLLHHLLQEASSCQRSWDSEARCPSAGLPPQFCPSRKVSALPRRGRRESARCTHKRANISVVCCIPRYPAPACLHTAEL